MLESVIETMRCEYLHFLHRLTTLGLIATAKCGVFRKGPVHIEGNPELVFPPPSAVPRMMEEYCRDFPTFVIVSFSDVDILIHAARASHRFVRIHPYSDGNGRMSRLLMNLVLWKDHPPVYLKADKKGRHRYIQALKRADNGKYKPLATLIAFSLSEVYDRLLASVAKPPPTDSQE
jgi:Fic family protein